MKDTCIILHYSKIQKKKKKKMFTLVSSEGTYDTA